MAGVGRSTGCSRSAACSMSSSPTIGIKLGSLRRAIWSRKRATMTWPSAGRGPVPRTAGVGSTCEHRQAAQLPRRCRPSGLTIGTSARQAEKRVSSAAPVTELPWPATTALPGARGGIRRPNTGFITTTEWGRPVGEEDRIYEKLCLEGFQSGLSWLTSCEKEKVSGGLLPTSTRRSWPRFGEAGRPTAALRRLHHPSSGQNRGDYCQRPGRRGIALAGQIVSQPGMGLRSARPERPPASMADLPSSTQAIEGTVGPTAPARLPLRRPHDRVRVDAVPWRGERPPPRLPCPAATRPSGWRSRRPVSPWTGSPAASRWPRPTGPDGFAR